MKTLSFVLLLALVCCASMAVAQIPRTISYQGVLSDTLGNPKADVPYIFSFRLYSTSSASQAQWTEIKVLQTRHGLFSTVLGDVTPFPDSVRFDRKYWLGIQIGVDPELVPRIELNAVAYSMTALRADTARYALNAPQSPFVDSARIAGTVPNNSITGSKIQNGTINFSNIGQNGALAGQVVKWNGSTWIAANDSAGSGSGIYLPLGGGTMTGAITSTGDPSITMGKGNFGTGNTNAGEYAFAAGRNSHAHGNYSTVFGGGAAPGDSNVAVGNWSTISGGVVNRASNNFTTVGGGLSNTASGVQATVSGGGNNNARGNHSVVGGGGGDTPADTNSAIGDYSTIGGGMHNLAGLGFYTTVGGGRNNTAWGSIATVAGGDSNQANDTYATVGGGHGNTAIAVKTTIAGGEGNTATQGWATVGGGGGNVATGQFATVGGGGGNVASVNYATVGGGYQNVASGTDATVGGGSSNAASGYEATVSGGGGNVASGNFSFAAGRRAKAINGGSFVWADSTDADFASQKDNTFLIRASGGVGIGKTNPAYQLDVNGTINATDILKNGSPLSSSQWMTTGNNIYYSAGAVGVGTGEPIRRLHINDSLSLGLGGTGFAGSVTFLPPNALSYMNIDNPGDLGIGRLRFTEGITPNGGTELMTIRSDGRVGIGIANPYTTLHIRKDAHGGAGAYLTLMNGIFALTQTDLSYENVGIDFDTYDPLSTDPSARIKAISDNTFSSNLVFMTKTPGDKSNTLAERMRITSDGKVGMGVANPYTTLHLRKDAHGGAGAYLTLMNGVTGQTDADFAWENVGIDFDTYDPLGADPSARISAIMQSGFSSDLVFMTKTPGASSNTLSERMRITYDGKVGIGTASPSEKLSVSGNICYTGSSFACSDIRYKWDVQALSGSLSNVMKLQGVNYNWRVDEYPDKKFNHDRQVGLIAQDVEKVYPELVITDQDGYKSVDYAKLTPILIEAVKEQQREISTLTAANTELTERLAQVEKAVQALIAERKEQGNESLGELK